MTLIYIVGFIFVAVLSLRSIAKSLKKGVNSYEYAKNEMKESRINEHYKFDFKN